jgi:hypothetical protein
MSSINFSRDTESADYLNAMRKELAASKAKNTKSSAMLEYILDLYNTITFTNALTLNGNKFTFANIITMVNAISRTDQLSQTFVVDTATVDFSDVNSGAISYTFLLSDGSSYILLNDGSSKLIGSDTT